MITTTSIETKKIIQPRAHTPSTGARELTTTGRLPDDLLSEQVRRLAVTGAVGAGLWTFGLVMDGFVRPRTVVTAIPAVTIAIEILGLVLSAAMFAYVRYVKHTPETKTHVGLLYMLVNAIFVAVLNTWARTPATEFVSGVSWNTIVILVCSMIISTTPRRMLTASIVAASMDPLGVWVAHLRGLPVPSVVNTFVLFMPNYACAVVATLPSHVLQRVGRRLRQAQEMGSYHLVELLGRGGMGEV